MATTLAVGGSSVSLSAFQLGRLTVFTRKGYPQLAFYQRGGELPASPDPFLGKEAVLTIDGTVRFRGDVTSAHPTYDPHIGWTVSYSCLGLRRRGDRIPHVDPATGSQQSKFNLQPEDPLYDGSRAGRTVGQVLTTVLTGADNGAALTAKGLANLTHATTYSLPAATTTDLAALSTIPPCPVSFGGEKLLEAVEGFLAQWAPNHMFWIDPEDGTFRFLDTRSFSGHMLTMGTDPIDPTPLSRDWTDCFQKVIVQGRPIAVMALLKKSNGTLVEDFAHDGLDNAGAKSAWTPAKWQQPADAIDSGTVTCTTTTSISYRSSDSSRTYGADDLDQSHRQATITLSSTIIADYTQFWHARVVANTALSAGGSCTLTIDAALPSTSYDHATLSMQAQSSAVVWTKYQIANSNLWPRVTNQSTYPAPFINASGGVSFVSSPMGYVLRTDGVTAPAPFTYNASDGTVRFLVPTYITGNLTAPSDVWVLIPVWTNPLRATKPAAGYEGTSNTVEGLTDTLYVEVDNWRDPAQHADLEAFAQDLLNSVKDTVVEGQIVYHGLYSTVLAPGIALSVAGSDFTSGWESAALPVVEVEVDWPAQGPTNHVTTLRCSNRRGHLSPAAWMHPERAWVPIGAGADIYGGLEFGILGRGFQVGTPYGPLTAGNVPGNIAPTEMVAALNAGYTPEQVQQESVIRGEIDRMMQQSGAESSGLEPPPFEEQTSLIP